jgi:hypothetical protein
LNQWDGFIDLDLDLGLQVQEKHWSAKMDITMTEALAKRLGKACPDFPSD